MRRIGGAKGTRQERIFYSYLFDFYLFLNLFVSDVINEASEDSNDSSVNSDDNNDSVDSADAGAINLVSVQFRRSNFTAHSFYIFRIFFDLSYFDVKNYKFNISFEIKKKKLIEFGVIYFTNFETLSRLEIALK